MTVKQSDLTELDRREITLWRIVGRYDEAVQRGQFEAAAKLEDGFRKRLADYQAAFDQKPQRVAA